MKVIWTWKLFITIAYYVIFDIPVEPGSTSDTCWLQIWMESRCTPASPCTVRERERRWKQYSSHSGYHWSFLDFSAPTISVFSIPVFILKIEKLLALTFLRLISSEELSLTTSRTSSNSLIEMTHVCFLWTSYWHFLNAPIFLQNGMTEHASVFFTDKRTLSMFPVCPLQKQMKWFSIRHVTFFFLIYVNM